MVWSIQSSNALGCTIDASSGAIHPGTRSGILVVRATNGADAGYVEQELELIAESAGCNITGAVQGQVNSVDVTIALGNGEDGKSLGALSIYASNITGALYTPAGLDFYARGGGNVIRKADGSIRQVLAGNALANVVATNSAFYAIDFYPANTITNTAMENGIKIYIPSFGRCLRRTRVLNPDDGATNRLMLVDYDPIHATTNSVMTYAVTNGVWSLTTGSGARSETKTTAWSETNTLETVTREIRGAQHELVAVRTEKHRVYAFGKVLVEETWGGNSDARTNRYVFNPTTGDLEQFYRYDGYWEWSAFNNLHRKVRTFVPFQNATATTNDATQCRVFEYGYTNSADDGSYSPDVPRVVVEKLLGSSQEIRRQYQIVKEDVRVDIYCPQPGLELTNALNLCVTNYYYTNGGFAQSLKRTDYPDGTMALFKYYLGDGTRTNVVMAGQPDVSRVQISDGIRVTTVVGMSGETLVSTKEDIATGLVLERETAFDFDDFGRPQKIVHLDGTTNQIGYGCCGPESVTSKEGVVTAVDYDGLKRPAAYTRNGVTLFSSYDAEGNLLGLLRRGTNSQDMTTFSAVYDTTGRQRTNWNALGQKTVFGERGAPLVKTATYANTATNEWQYFRDGTLAAQKGTAGFPVRFSGGVLTDGGVLREYRAVIRLTNNAAWSDTAEQVTNVLDGIGRVYKVLHPNGAETIAYNNLGQVEKTVDRDGVTTIFQYNARGEKEVAAVKRGAGSTIDWGNDSIGKVTREITTNTQGKVIVRFSSYRWISGTTGTLVGIQEATADGLETKTIALDDQGAWTNSTVTAYEPANRIRRVTTTGADGTYAVVVYQDGRLLSASRYASGGSLLGSVACAYDAHGRRGNLTDALTGTVVTNAFNEADWVTGASLKAPDTALQMAGYEYDSMGQIWRTTLPDGLTVTNSYHLNGLPRYAAGGRTYPSEIGYDAQGRIQTLATWTNSLAGSSAVTTWQRDPATGMLSAKKYSGEVSGPSLTFTAGGRPRTRVSGRNVTTTYATNVAGQVSAVTYSDTNTAALGLGYDRVGRLTVVTNGSAVTTNVYSTLGLRLSESQNGLTVSNGVNALLQRESVSLWHAGTNVVTTSFQYDHASRLLAVVGSGFQVTNYYNPTSGLPQALAFQVGAQTPLTLSKTYDGLNRLRSVSAAPSAAGALSFAVGYNPANQRTNVTWADGSWWQYGYDWLGQLTSAHRYWADGTPVAGQQFDYVFDEAGNRRVALAGGNGTGQRSTVYAPNTLNQVTNRNVPGYVDVLGLAPTNAVVRFNGQVAERQGEYFRKELAAGNSAGPVWLAVSNLVSLSLNATNELISTNVGRLYVAPANETLLYDADGNLTNDGRWSYTWDAENRLVQMETTTAAASAGVPRQKVGFGYDAFSRRTSKTVYESWNGTSYQTNAPLKFVYDGWNLLAVLDANNAPVLSFTWGNDVSGTPQGAGGIGGLLAMRVHGGTYAGLYLYAYDGSHNAVALVNAADGTMAAQYEYGPFHELLRATGPLAFINPFTASTKYYDWETGLSYFGYRYYSAALGRWLGREPLGEMGGVNLYGFCVNNTLGCFDYLGLEPHWTDGVASSFNAQAQEAKAITSDNQSWVMAGIINSFIDMGATAVNLLPAVAHLGEATGATGEIGNEALVQPVSNFGTGFGQLSVEVNVESIQNTGNDLLVISSFGTPTKPFTAYNTPINALNNLVSKIPKAPPVLTTLAPGFKPIYIPGPLGEPVPVLDQTISGNLFNTPVQNLLKKPCKISTPANLSSLAEQDVVVGLIKDGQVLKQVMYPSDPMLAPSHEAIAKELGVWVGNGELAPGVEAFTVWKECGKVNVRGSGNFNPAVSPANDAALKKLFE